MPVLFDDSDNESTRSCARTQRLAGDSIQGHANNALQILLELRELISRPNVPLTVNECLDGLQQRLAAIVLKSVVRDEYDKAVEIGLSCLHRFEVTPAGAQALDQIELPLTPSEAL